MNRFCIRCIAVGLLGLHVLLLAYSAYRHSPTQDEVAHLPAGLAIWKFGDFSLYRVNPPLARAVAALPLLMVDHHEDWQGYRPGAPQRQEWLLGRQFVHANGRQAFWLFTLSRWACIPFSILGAVVCWRWASELTDEICGLSALLLWCLSPNMIGHGALITPDIAAVSCGLLAAYSFSKWRACLYVSTLFVAGICLGIALISKTYWVTLLVLWPLIAVIDAIKLHSWRPVWQVAGMLLLGLNVLNVGYGFQGTGTNLGRLPFFSKELAGELRNPELERSANRFEETPFGEIPIPIPSDYLTGIDVQRADFQLGKWSYLLGKTGETGWWYYYLIGLAVKVPVGALVLALLGTTLGLTTGRGRRILMQLAPLLLPAVVVFSLASSQTGINRHVRYVFCVLPVFFILSSLAVCLSGQRARPVLYVLLAWLSVSSLACFPHSLSYFNELAGGPRRGHEILIDSNIDWGQDLIFVEEWLAAHPDARPVFLTWLGYLDLSAVGIDVPSASMTAETPGWYIVSVHQLHAPHERFAKFLSRMPVDRIGYSFHVYNIAEEFEEGVPTSGNR